MTLVSYLHMEALASGPGLPGRLSMVSPPSTCPPEGSGLQIEIEITRETARP